MQISITFNQEGSSQLQPNNRLFFSKSEIATLLGISLKTLNKRISESGAKIDGWIINKKAPRLIPRRAAEKVIDLVQSC